jgi:hypothetical protein
MQEQNLRHEQAFRQIWRHFYPIPNTKNATTDWIVDSVFDRRSRSENHPSLPIGSRKQFAGTSAAIRAFLLRTVEARNMPFSLGSYLIGVGTVVGTLAFGFGSGVLLTHTAMRESPAGQTRVERLAGAKPETPAASQTPAAQVTPTPNPDEDRRAGAAAIKQATAPAEQPAAVPPDPVPAAQAGTPKPDAARKPETPGQTQTAKESQPMNQAARESQPPKQAERTEAKPFESRETDRRAERLKRYAERRPLDTVTPRMRQRRFMVQDEPAQEVVVSRSPQQEHFDLFGGLFGRPADGND